MIALEQRHSKGENDTLLLERAQGRYCLLLNEDSELEPGTTMALYEALDAGPARAPPAPPWSPRRRARAVGLALPQPGHALLTALWLHRRFVVQSRGDRVRDVDWVQSAAMLVRREAADAVGHFDPSFYVYSDEVDFCKRLHDAGWRVLYVPRPAPCATRCCRRAPCRSSGSSRCPATVTATCASTTPPPPPAPCAG